MEPGKEGMEIGREHKSGQNLYMAIGSKEGN
jgi:hypothetical protein